MSREFVSIKEITSRYPAEYVGIVDGRSKDSLTAICVRSDDDKTCALHRKTFELDGWKIRSIKIDVVRRAFDICKLELKSELDKATMDLGVSKLRFECSEALYKEAFPK